jgi:glycosyltransferase involved in cell wall biosynthesis
MTVGVVIPCRNEAHWIGEVLDALAAQDRLPDEVVVVDDGSTDGTREVVEQWASSRLAVRVIAGPARGVAAALNAGIAELNTEVIVRLDGHCHPAPDYVRRAAELATAPGVGVAGGAWTIVPSAPTLEAQAIAIAVGHAMGSGGAAYRQASGRAGEQVDPARLPARLLARSVDTVPFGCFRRSLWEELGGLDERLRSNEDYDFNFRARERGLRVMLDPTIRCTYYARPTLHALMQQYGRYGWWKARMLALHPRSIRVRQLLPALLVPALLVGALGLMVRPDPLWPILLACYPALLAAGAAHAAVTRGRPAAAPWIAAAFFTNQMMWSAGFWAAMLSGPRPKAQGPREGRRPAAPSLQPDEDEPR